MISDENILRPVKVAGIGCIVMTVFGFLFHLKTLTGAEFEAPFKYFVIIMIGWHLITGSGILMQKIWGYYLMKFYLYVMLLAVPIGTYLALKGLKYIKENDIKKYYQNQ